MYGRLLPHGTPVSTPNLNKESGYRNLEGADTRVRFLGFFSALRLASAVNLLLLLLTDNLMSISKTHLANVKSPSLYIL